MPSKKEAVKKWRNLTKERIIQSMGGCCQICSYNNCNGALELHHINPNEKEMSFGKIRANPIAWSKIVNELRKCVLLCANCHREIHAEIILLSNTYARFDESFVTYREVKELTAKIKSIRKVDWSNVDLETLLKDNNSNFSKIGRLLNVSDNAIRKRAKLLNLI